MGHFEVAQELERVSYFDQSIIWHQHMEDHVEMDHFIKFGAFMLNRYQDMDL